MKADIYPVVKDLVLVGGGHSHALMLRMWGMNPLPGVRVTLINPDPATPYTGMLPGHIAGHYPRADIMIDLVRLARFANARLILDRVAAIDPVQKHVHFQGRPPLPYDIASLDVGIHSAQSNLPGFANYVTSAKPLDQLSDRWAAFVTSAPSAPKLVVLGGGIGGCELALAMAERLVQTGRTPNITVLERASQVLPNIGAAARAVILKQASRYGITFLTDCFATLVEKDSLLLSSGVRLEQDFVLSVIGAQPHAWLAECGLETEQGFVTVDRQLRSSDPFVFAVGDCAAMSFAPRPKAGVFAVRQAPILYHNARALLSGDALRSYAPQRDYMKLVSLGGKRAVADKFGLRGGGEWVWRLKDRIDQQFMDKFATYPSMAAPVVPANAALGLAEVLAQKPLCGGCGSKLGAGTLQIALNGVGAPMRTDVLSGRGDDAAVLAVAGGVQVISTDHLRGFSHDMRLMARIAAQHALGDIWAMGARPQVALAQVILPRASGVIAARMLAEIMDQAGEIFRAEGADVVGGHSTFGAELTIGFTVTGLAVQAIAKSGAKPGDILLLTKPLGTGVILAADMAMAQLPGQVLGEAVASAYASMTSGLGRASVSISPYAHAMTDVTGFGLMGHLLEILHASGVGALLDLDAVPTLPAAQELSDLGYGSILDAANRASTFGRVKGAAHPKTALLYDPQTGGGLLAAIDPTDLQATFAALDAAGQRAWVIGRIVAGPAEVQIT
jgi:selenide,water dikinase